jgi:hypothetical protein
VDKTTTIINVKGMPVDAWEQAKRAANRRGQTMGEWLGNACTQQANREAGDGVIVPGQGEFSPSSPRVLPVDLREVAALIAAMSQANIPVQKRVGAVVNRLLYAQLRAAEPARVGGAARIGHDVD